MINKIKSLYDEFHRLTNTSQERRTEKWNQQKLTPFLDKLNWTVVRYFCWRHEYSQSGLLTLRYLYHLVVNHTDTTRQTSRDDADQTTASEGQGQNNIQYYHQDLLYYLHQQQSLSDQILLIVRGLLSPVTPSQCHIDIRL